MRTKIFGILVLILSLSTSCMMMSPMHSVTDGQHHNAHHGNFYTDLVCGIEVNTNEAVSYNYSGNTYYFDSDECMTVFQKNPDRFTRETNNRDYNLISTLAIAGGGLLMLAFMALMLF